jgi:hypothetical protein
MGENARIWKIYRDEAIEFDKDNIDEWHNTLDWLLIFVRYITTLTHHICSQTPYRLVSFLLQLPHS